MAISKSIDFKGLPVSAAYIRVNRIFGGKKEGWNALVMVYASNAKANPAPVQTGERQKRIDGALCVDEAGDPVMEPVFTTPAPEHLTELNFRVPYVDGANPYTLVYDGLKADPRFEGAVDC